MAKTYSKMKDPGFREKANDFYVRIQIVGTPDDCIQQLGELRQLTGTDHIVCDFAYGAYHTTKLSWACACLPTVAYRRCNATMRLQFQLIWTRVRA